MPPDFHSFGRRCLTVLLGFLLVAPPAYAQEPGAPSGPTQVAPAGPTGAGAPSETPATAAALRFEQVAIPAGGTNFALDTPEAIKNFTLSVGDTFTVNVWGSDLRFNQTFTIPFEGKIFIPQVGEILVNGLNTGQVKTKISGVLAKRHPNLNVSVLLVNTRPVRVFVTGMVGRPGVVQIPALSRLSGALDGAGGSLIEGSTRQITVTRHGAAKPLLVDYYRFLLKGDVASNPVLKAGDIIYVPQLTSRVLIQGLVYRPGNYEFLPGETIEDLLTMAHGPKPGASLTEASLVNLKSTKRIDRIENRLDLSSSASRSRPLQDEDQVTILANTLAYVAIARTRITVAGAVTRPGPVVLTGGTKLRDALAQVGSIKPGAGLHEVRIYHKVASGEAKFDDPVTVSAYKLLFENDESQNLDLQDGDLILVPDSKDLAEDSAIYVHGQVGKPGKVPFRAGNRLTDYLNAAGGPLGRAALRSVSIIRAGSNKVQTVDAYQILREGKFERDPVLKPGDIVNVPEEFFYISNFQDVVNTILAAAGIYSVIRTLQPQGQ